MREVPSTITAVEKRRNLTLRFCVAGMGVMLLMAALLTLTSYFQMRTQSLTASLDDLARCIAEDITKMVDSGELVWEPLNDTEYYVGRNLPASIALIGEKVRSYGAISDVAIYSLDKKLLWQIKSEQNLSVKENVAFSKLLASQKDSMLVDLHMPSPTSLDELLGKVDQPIINLLLIKNTNSEPYVVVKIIRNYEFILNAARKSTYQKFRLLLIGNILLFFALFYVFTRGLQTIEDQETKLNQQITRLSNLLAINQSMQKSMKTASSRAVELNEQFLRRVGSDLHDGPAQSLGYALLRLNRISEDEGAKSFSHEFHVVREALDTSIDEIRGISSGLVLPELEKMTLEQALKKVVSRHSMNSKTEVNEYYKDLPDDIALPYKITAYRFVQEGLNNAHRHGQAEKCRITAQVKDDVLHLSLKDNGMGFRKSQLSTEGGHLGLMGLKDRIESLGGRFTINSELGVGTAIKVSIAITDDALPL